MICKALYIYVSGADPGFWKRGGGGLINILTTGGGVREGACPSRDSKGVWGLT